MGLIRAAVQSAASAEWRISGKNISIVIRFNQLLLAVKEAKENLRRVPIKRSENVISNLGSVIAVNEGTVHDDDLWIRKVVDVCAQPGEYAFMMRPAEPPSLRNLGENY